MFSSMYGLVTAYYVRGYQSTFLTASFLNGLVNCTRNFEKSVKNRITLQPNIFRTKNAIENLILYLENSISLLSERFINLTRFQHSFMVKSGVKIFCYFVFFK